MFKLHIRRPIPVMALFLVLILWISRMAGYFDSGGRTFPEADARHLCVSGTVISKESLSEGYRLTLNSLQFISRTQSRSAQKAAQSSGIYTQIINSLNEKLKPEDRLLIYLTGGGSGNLSVYGEGEKTQFWTDQKRSVDQRDIFDQSMIGNRLILTGKCAEPEEPSNPGQFNSRQYQRARHICLTMSDVSLLSSENAACGFFTRIRYRYQNFLADLRCRLQDGVKQIFGDTDSALISAVVLGDKSGLDDETKQLFQDGGISHILAISSLHVTILGMSLYRFLRKLRASFLLASVFAAAVVLSYCMMTGGSVSSVRAVIMFLFWLGAQITGRTNDSLTAIGASALFILIRTPYALWDTSFLLSYACILSTVWMTPAAVRIFPGNHPIIEKLRVSLIIWLGSLPITLWAFYQTSLYAVFVNLLVLPLMSIFMAFGMLAGLISLLPFDISFFFGSMAGEPCHDLLQFYKLLCSLEQKLPGSVWITGRPSAQQVFAYYLILTVLILIVMRCSSRSIQEHFLRFRILLLSAILGSILLLTIRIRPDFRVTILDVGQGSSCLIESGGKVFLLDAGSSSVTNVWKYRISSAIRYYGIDTIDGVILSHADADHINGIEQMLTVYKQNFIGRNTGDVTIRNIYLPKLPDEQSAAGILDAAKEKKIPIAYLSEGMQIRIGEDTQNKKGICTILHILAPSAERLTGKRNEDCIVILLEQESYRILFSGDLEGAGEAAFAKAYQGDPLFQTGDQSTMPETVLIAGHHGSRNASNQELLDLVRPDLAVISCGKNNRYGHPHTETLSRLEEAGVKILRTDQNGCITINGMYHN